MDFRNEKLVFLLTHPPDPRIMKRIEAMAEISNNIEIIFWDRFSDFLKYSSSFKTIPIRVSNSSNFYIRIINGLLLTFKSLLYLFNCKPELIYIDGIDMVLPAFLYKHFSFRKTKLILEIADIPIIRYRKKHKLLGSILEKLTNLFVSKVDLLILTSPYFWSDYYSKIYPHQEKVILIENVPEKSLFMNFRPGTHEDFVIGFVGSIRYVKQLEVLFDACRGLEGVRIIIAGSGPEAPQLERIIGNYQNVYFLGPYDYRKDVLKIYSQIDLVYAVYDTTLENVKVALPNKLYEAIVCEIPIVVARGTKLSDYVEKLGVGFSVSDNNPEELKNLIIKLKSNPKIIKDIKEREKRIKEKFYWENIKEDFKKRMLELMV